MNTARRGMYGHGRPRPAPTVWSARAYVDVLEGEDHAAPRPRRQVGTDPGLFPPGDDIVRQFLVLQALHLGSLLDNLPANLFVAGVDVDGQLSTFRYIEKLAPTINTVLLPSNPPFMIDIQSLLEQPQQTLPSGTPRPIPSSP